MTSKKLTRSRENKIFGGVCGGLGDYFEIDPLLFRIIFLVLLFVGGGGFLLYLIFWIILPQNQITFSNTAQEQPFSEQFTPENNSKRGSFIAGGILLGLGLIFLANNYVSWLHLSKLWPLILVVIGLVMIINYFSKNNNSHEEK